MCVSAVISVILSPRKKYIFPHWFMCMRWGGGVCLSQRGAVGGGPPENQRKAQKFQERGGNGVRGRPSDNPSWPGFRQGTFDCSPRSLGEPQGSWGKTAGVGVAILNQIVWKVRQTPGPFTYLYMSSWYI